MNLESPEAETELARSLVDEGVAPDAAVGWARRTDIGWQTAVGWTRAVSLAGAEPIFDLASVTKPFLAVAVARSGLARTTPLADALPVTTGTASAGVPIELFLAHRAGLAAHLALFEPLVRGAPFDRAGALRAAAGARTAPPDGAALYSDLGYILAGEALARTEGARDAGEVIEARAVPGGAEIGTARALRARRVDFDARVRPTEVVAWRGGEIRGAVHDENAWALTGDGGSGHAGLFGTAGGVLAFGREVLDGLARLDWLVAPRPGGTLRAGFDGKSAEGSSAGALLGRRTFGHLGFTGTSLWIDPDAAIVVVVLTNRVHPTRENVAIRAARPRVHDALFRLASSTQQHTLRG